MPAEPSHILTSVQSVPEKDAGHLSTGFSGFLPLASNTTYTPNQFFDVCLPHCSRSAIRLVGYFIRRTLGWCDQYGQPQEEQVEISFRELAAKAGVNRDGLRAALDEAIAGHFIDCVREGRPSTARDAGQSAIYRLRWHDTPDYLKTPAAFRGFFEREGNRTDIPNQYFDHLIPSEPLSVIKVVGSIIRSSIGFAAHRGARRQCASLSYSQIRNFTRLHSRKDLSLALRTSLDQRYIVRLEEGYFTHEKAEQRSAVYALRWTDRWLGDRTGRKSLPEVPRGDRSDIPTSTGRISPPENRSEITTSLKTKLLNEREKQLQPAAESPSFEILRKEGFNEKAARDLAAAIPLDTIHQQIAWLAHRGEVRNRRGMLRRAMEEAWPEPSGVRTSGLLSGGDTPEREFVRNFYAGFHCHRGDPINEPSSRECHLAKSVVGRLLAGGEVVAGLPRWGRALGEMAREQPNPLPSFVVAIRQLGDRLLATASQLVARRRREALEKAREEHLAKHHGDYLDFLRRREVELRTSTSLQYAAFEASREAEIERLNHSRTPWAEAMLRQHVTERQRLHDLRGHFQLPEFWEWDAAENPYPFNPKT